MMLLNCTQCDDLLKLVDRVRTCECGRSSGHLTPPRPPVVTGPARLIEIPWEQYDLASGGHWQRWRLVLPRSR